MNIFKRNSQSGSRRQVKQLLGYVVVAGLLGLLLVYWLTSPLARDWENRFQSNYYLLRSAFSHPEASPLPMVVILIDDNSLPAGSSRSPIDRGWLAEQVQKIAAENPALIVFNILLDRLSTETADRELADALRQSGKVILRDDPHFPVRSLFSEAALDRGSMQFRLDSTGTVQDVCNSAVSCRSPQILHHRIWRKITSIFNLAGAQSPPSIPWLKINFSETPTPQSNGQLTAYPVIRAHEIDKMAPDALQGKIVLIGSGFADIYPLYRIPLDDPQMEMQETEILAQLLTMMAQNSYLRSVSGLWMALFAFGFMVAVALILIYRGILPATIITLLAILAYFILCSVGFAFLNLEIPFIVPAIVLFLFLSSGILYQSVRERFFRLSLELQLKQKKIDYLTNELHAHHLFNEFSRISVMIRQNPESAREYLIEFAEMLRLSLKYGDQQMVPISIQMEYIELFINQQRIIHQDRLKFELNLETESLRQYHAPWHIFFPLVENAVKYSGVYLKNNPETTPTIRIDVTVSERQLTFEIENPFDATTTTSSQTGLKNLRNRLDLAFPRGNYFLDSSGSQQTWIGRLQIPVGE